MRYRRMTRGNVAGVLAIALTITLVGCASLEQSPPPVSPSGEDLPAGADAQVYALVPANIKEKGSITLTTDPSWPPCEYFDKADPNTMIGFEPDLWNAIGEKMGVTIKVEPTAFAQMIPGVVSGRYDVAMECLTDNPERETQVDFVDLIYSTIGTMAPKDNPHNVSDDPLSICGLRIATVSASDLSGYVQNIVKPQCADAGLPAPQDTEFTEQAQVMLALDSKRVDVTLYAVTSAAFLIKEQNAPYVIFANESLPKKYGGPVFNKDNPDLRDAWLAATKAIHGDGQYKQIMQKWGLEINMLEEPGVNLATTRPLN